MKGLRFMLLGLAICLASGVKAQFYDSADDIYYYLMYEREYDMPYLDTMHGFPQWKTNHKKETYNESEEAVCGRVIIFNFDGNKAAILANNYNISSVKSYLQQSSSYFEDKVETTEYKLKYSSSSSGTVYKEGNNTYTFSYDRNTLVSYNPSNTNKCYYKRVEKSFFKIGRSRTPNGTLHE